MLTYLSSWDDGNAEDVRIADLMDRYEVPTIFFWPVYWKEVNQVKKRSFLTPKEAQDIASRFVVGSHTLTHPILTEVDRREAEDQIKVSRNLLRKMFNQPIDGFCYPRGRYNAEIVDIVESAGYSYARTTKVGSFVGKVNRLEAPTSVHVGYDRQEYEGMDWLSYGLKVLKEAKEQAINRHTYFSIWGHGAELARYPDGFKKLETLLKAMIA